VWIEGEPRMEYAKVRAEEGALSAGRRASVLREGHEQWLDATIIPAPAGIVSSGFVLWLRLDPIALPEGS
jgi:hypothetical protein